MLSLLKHVPPFLVGVNPSSPIFWQEQCSGVDSVVNDGGCALQTSGDKAEAAAAAWCTVDSVLQTYKKELA